MAQTTAGPKECSREQGMGLEEGGGGRVGSWAGLAWPVGFRRLGKKIKRQRNWRIHKGLNGLNVVGARRERSV